jgi:hypothetical protein
MAWQLSNRLLSPAHCQPLLQFPLLQASSLISQRKSPGVGILGLLEVCGGKVRVSGRAQCLDGRLAQLNFKVQKDSQS